MTIDNNPPLRLHRITTAYIDSGSFNGSLDYEVRPSVYHYSNYDATAEKNEEIKKEFLSLLENYLDDTTVNNSLSLREYLTLLTSKDQEALTKVHKKVAPRPRGASLQELPVLLFSGADRLPQFTIDLFEVDLKGSGLTALYQFMYEHATHFSSAIPDAFFSANYPKAL